MRRQFIGNETITSFLCLAFFGTLVSLSMYIHPSCRYKNRICESRSLPVTVIVIRIAKKNKIKEFEEWISGISKEVSR